MGIKKEQLVIRTSKKMEVIDITSPVREVIKNKKVANGVALILSKHTSAAITMNENDAQFLKKYNLKKGLFEDMIKTFSNMIPPGAGYSHDKIHQKSNTQLNTHAHIISAMIGHSALIEIEGNELCLSEWGRILLIELDGPRKRDITIIILY